MSGGQALTSGQGTSTTAITIALKSRKFGTGSTDRALTGSAVSVVQGQHTVIRGVTLAGSAVSLANGAVTAFGGGAALSWNSTPNVQIPLGSTTPVSLGTFVSSYNAGTDTITLVSGTLPSGVTLAANSLVPNGSQAVTTASNIVYRVTRGAATADSSAASVSVVGVSWATYPSITFVEGSTAGYYLATHISDYNSGTDVFSIVSGNPGWLSIVGAYLVPNGQQTDSSDITNLVLGVSRSGGAVVSTVALGVTVNVAVVGGPYWSQPPKPFFYLGTTAPYSLRNFMGDYAIYNGDRITLAPGSASLPAGMSIVRATIVPDGTQALGSTSGIKLRLQRPGFSPQDTGTFTITVSEVTSSPALIQYEGLRSTGNLGFGKHSQWNVTPDGKWCVFGGDPIGIDDYLNLQVDPYLPSEFPNFPDIPRGNYAAPFEYNLNNNLSREQMINWFGVPTDGTRPWWDDGCTWVYNPNNNSYYSIPGYTPGGPTPGQVITYVDPYGIGGYFFRHVHRFDRTQRKWIAEAYAGTDWPGEHWGGAMDASRNKIHIQAGGGQYGRITSYDCTAKTFSALGMWQCPGLESYAGIGYEVNTRFWRQWMNYTTDELICFDGYRGLILGISMTPISGGYMPRIIGRVPPLQVPDPDNDNTTADNDETLESVSTIEAGVAFSLLNQKVYLTYSNKIYPLGGVSGIWEVDLTNGNVRRTPYDVATMGADASWTESFYDDVNQKLVLVGSTMQPPASPVDLSKYFGIYAKSTVARPSWAAGTAVGEWRAIPNSQPVTQSNLFLVNDAHVNIGFPAVTWGGMMTKLANKYGEIASNSAGTPRAWPHGDGFNKYGCAPDPRNGRVFVPYDIGDYEHTGWIMCDFNRDSPLWYSEVVKSASYLNIKVFGDSSHPSDDIRVERNFDGSCRVQHGYHNKCYLPTTNQVGYVGHQQFGPADQGSSPKAVLASVATGLWLPGDPLPDRPGYGNDIQDFIRVDHKSGKIHTWSLSQQTLFEIDPLSPTSWRTVRSDTGSFRPHGALDHENGEMLLVDDAGTGRIINIVSGARTNVTFSGNRAASLSVGILGGLTYCPLQHAYFFKNRYNAEVFVIRRTGSTTFSCDLFAVTNVPSWTLPFDKLGGVLNDFFSVPSLGGIVFRINDLLPMYFLGTA